MQDRVHELRKQIDAVIQASQAVQFDLGRGDGGREVSLVVTKLQEGKMWAGKILEALGSELPPQFRDAAAQAPTAPVEPVQPVEQSQPEQPTQPEQPAATPAGQATVEPTA